MNLGCGVMAVAHPAAVGAAAVMGAKPVALLIRTSLRSGLALMDASTVGELVRSTEERYKGSDPGA